MQDHQKRVVEEKEQLDIKREKLRQFIMDQKGEFNDLNGEERGLLISQQQMMNQYADILGRRIEAFKE